MATIDGVTFNLTKLQPTIRRSNISNKIPSSNHITLTNMGFNGMSLVVDGYVDTEAEYDNVLKAFLSDGEKALARKAGEEYRVHIDKNQPTNKVKQENAEHYKFSFNLISEYPYRFTTAQTTRSKTITTDGQTWSADDSSNSISTAGHVPAMPDVKLSVSSVGSSYDRQVFDGTTQTGDSDTFDSVSETYGLRKTDTLPGVVGHKVNLTNINCEIKPYSTVTHAYVKVTYEYTGQAETDLKEWDITNESDYIVVSEDVDITAPDGEDVTLRWYVRTSDSFQDAYVRDRGYVYARLGKTVVLGADVINTEYSDTVLNVCNICMKGEYIRINADNTGHIDLTDTYDSDEWAVAHYESDNVSRDGVGNKLDVTTDGYVIYKIDTKYPITGLPLVTSLVNITTGTPTIQVAADDGNGDPDTWYDIDQSVVDGVETEYKLRSRSNDFKFKGRTILFLKFNFASASGSIGSVDIDIDMFALDAAKLQIDTDGANEFQVDFSSGSRTNCTIDLIYNDRKYVA